MRAHGNKIWVVLLFFVVSVSGCALLGTSLSGTQLTIKNDSSMDLTLIQWNDTYFGDDSIWDSDLLENVDGIAAGSQSTENVTSGTGYIYFWISGDSQQYRTAALVTVSKDEQMNFTFTGSTTIVAN